MKPIRTKKGFTLPEILVVLSISVVVGTMSSSFLIESMRVSLGITNNLDIELSIRKITNELSDEALEANSFIIYQTYFDAGHAISGSFRSPALGVAAADYRIRRGESGNFCLFIYNGIDPTPSDSNPAPIERLVGYYLNTEAEADAQEILKFNVSVPTSDQYAAFESLIPSPAASSTHEVVVPRANGLISGSLFYNLYDKSVMVNGEIIHGTPSKQSSGTYNFTVSPRG
ncbi:MAG: prepilin-type N-terminal cleavage/methylation domain-containing protein [Lentimonas sp.]|jgi:prepilin-type N-terminal cleavage/methylation domain-containing protein